MELIEKQDAINALKAIRHGLWEIDIPHPGNCPEYVEHHRQIKDMMEITDGWIRRLTDMPSAQPEYTEQDVREAFNAGYACGMSAARPEWHECFEDDPDSFPSDERMVLMSFSNFPTPAIGWFERDDNGGYWTDGDPKTLIELGLFVDGWWELPRKPRRN